MSVSKHRITVRNDTRSPVFPRTIKAALEAMLDSEDHPPSSIAVVVAGSAFVRKLNRKFRGVDASTDVLSFPAEVGPELEDHNFLGDIAICLPIAEKQAKEHELPTRAELACLAVHGGLHLLGYDDDTARKRASMIRKMNMVVASLGLPTTNTWSSITSK